MLLFCQSKKANEAEEVQLQRCVVDVQHIFWLVQHSTRQDAAAATSRDRIIAVTHSWVMVKVANTLQNWFVLSLMELK